jgi:glycosyltransferase involved in cell wall biosynthesis
MVIVGGEWSAEERKSLKELGISERMLLLHRADDETLRDLYNTAVAFVYPSLYEGFGIPLLEAMACGCPVVASSIPATIEVAGDCPVYFDKAEVEDLVPALDRVLLEGRDSPRTAVGLERVKAFSWGKTAEQTLAVYHSLAHD